MVVGIGIIDIYIAESRSLKEKRAVVRSILKRTQNKFSLSIAEVGDMDDWKRSRIGFAVVSNDRSFVNSRMDKVIGFVEGLELAQIVNTAMEIENISEVLSDVQR